MSSGSDDKNLASKRAKTDTARADDPEWASGLKRLYKDVVEEPLPDAFKDLLSKLDENGGK